MVDINAGGLVNGNDNGVNDTNETTFGTHFYYEEAELDIAIELEAEAAEAAEAAKAKAAASEAAASKQVTEAQQAEKETKVELKVENGGKAEKKEELEALLKLEAEALAELNAATKVVNDCAAGKNLPDYFQLKDEESKDKQKAFHTATVKRVEVAQEKYDILSTQAYAAKLSINTVETKAKYEVAKKLEYVVDADDENIVVRTRNEYVWLFKANVRRSALATLEMCRVVYEASKSLKEHEFDEFCEKVGYKPNSSTIRKFHTIGKVYPRLVQYAEQLPVAWTNIYLLTQIPADDFELCVQSTNFKLKDLSGSEISELVKKTRDISNPMSPFKQDKKLMAYCVANVYFTKRVDDTDFRLLQKAFNEIASRLPVKLVVKKEVTEMFASRRAKRYEALKVEDSDTMVKPQKWDYGFAANEVNGDTAMKKAA